MIGQKDLLKQVDKLIENGFPRFLVITGRKGQGKKYLSNIIAKKLNYTLVSIVDLKIDSVREIIELAYKQTEPIIYLIPDCDKMSLGAKNSLLKIIEEPPAQAHFIMTLEDINNTLETIKSRCIELKMQDYTEEELNEFINQYEITSTEKAILLDTCNNKYEIDLMIKYGVTDFYNYVDKVFRNIYKVQSANSFKIAEKLDINGEGYDLNLFFNTYKIICLTELTINNNLEDESVDFKCIAKSIETTSCYQQKLSITGINKQSLIDQWILDIRKIWREQ